MAYKEQVFSDGQVLLHTDLNTMSQGIVSKQDKLVSGQNIKTINGESLIGSGDITISGSGETSSSTKVKLEQITLSPFNEQSGYVTNKETGELETSSSGCFKDFQVEDSWVLYASGYAPKNTGVSAPVTYFDANNNVLGYEDFGLSSVWFENRLLESVPSGTTVVRVQASGNISGISLIKEIEVIVSAIGFSIRPLVEIGNLTAKGSISSSYTTDQTYYRTGKFIKPVNNNFMLKVSSDCEYSVYMYDNTFTYLDNSEWTPIIKNELVSISTIDDCTYIKLLFRKSEALENFGFPHVIIEGVEEKEYFNIKPSGNFQRLVIPVNVVNPASADTGEWVLKDTPDIRIDHGVFYLPDTYSNIGNPTRLIIYCHGAGVHYTSSVSGFPSTDCDPSYWLAEGCAVMDMDGNPFEGNGIHGYSPQAIQCYENAYDWIIRNYNICRDGVFLGGRSMGGGMTFDVLQSAIPVVASCPIVPVANELWWWNYMPGASRKFCAEHMGFTVPWPESTGGYIMTEEEYQCLQDNFDKMIKYAPLWRGIENLPSKEELFAVGRLNAKTVKEDEAEAALYSKLRFKVKAPVKIFASYEDATVPYARNCVYMYNMMKNAGQPCELRLFSTDAESAHHFEQRDSRANIEVTTVYGETMTAPLVYIEMMQFWRRYEKTF